jgi:transcription elongation factor GreA
VANSTTSISDAARLFGQSLPPDKHPEGQEALRFARWFGEERAAIQVRPSDIEAYVESFGATAPNAMTRAEALKSFLAYAHKQGILPERYVSHVRVRRPTTRGRVTSGSVSASDSRPELRLTAEGRLALETELDTLKAERPRIAQELRDARADGDVRENAPLDAAREAQGQIEARIRELEGMLRHVVVEEGATPAGDIVHIGCNVVLANITTGAKLSYQLVAAAEVRGGTGRLSAESPVGRAVLGHRQGEEVDVTAPSGVVRFRIESIEV